jgi:hypothetical protein
VETLLYDLAVITEQLSWHAQTHTHTHTHKMGPLVEWQIYPLPFPGAYNAVAYISIYVPPGSEVRNISQNGKSAV